MSSLGTDFTCWRDWLDKDPEEIFKYQESQYKDT